MFRNFVVCWCNIYINCRETWGKQRSELWQNLMGITSSKSKSLKPLSKMSCSGSRSPMFASSDCCSIPSQVSRASRPGFTCSTILLKRPASEDLSGTEDCAYSSESEDDEESRQLRSPVIQSHQIFISFTPAFSKTKCWKVKSLVSVSKTFETDSHLIPDILYTDIFFSSSASWRKWYGKRLGARSDHRSLRRFHDCLLSEINWKKI